MRSYLPCKLPVGDEQKSSNFKFWAILNSYDRYGTLPWILETSALSCILVKSNDKDLFVIQ